MMKKDFTLTEVFNTEPSDLYEAWLSTDGHSALTGSPSMVDGRVGGKFTAWDGYIFGTTLELTPTERIVQSWRTSEFADDSPDSHLEIHLERVEGGTKLTLVHSDLPPDQVDSYKQGWEDFYFKPMRAYYEG